ncbi:uncharacterized protein LOC131222493 [Magnolia sinica]|uniref:uncharacterized protein LOC131222493 n=1 Tax=Magnolia sinica TaxID=86752 RepID=UPI0026589D8E|nr:uncharacterized protein LOC131222493 [Magnolia sinica]
MAPSLGLDQERQPGSPVKFAERENGNASKVKDDAGLRCANNCEDDTFDMEAISDHHKVDEVVDAEVDIVDCANTSIKLTKAEEDPDATEYSSSFGNTVSGSGDGLKLNSSDDEVVESRFHHENGTLSVFDGLDRVFRPRKKKLTAHWRRYIRPLMWRCKWLELRVKELQSQALKYDRELLAYSHEKQLKVGQVASDGSAARSVTLSCPSLKKQVMKRRKRRRVEDTVDIRSYMSHHNIFSYYENKKSEADGISIDDDYGNQAVIMMEQDINGAGEFGINYEWPVFESKDGDNSLEQILWNIDVQQSRVLELKAQLNKLMCKNAGKFSSMENLSLFKQGDVPTGSALNPSLSPGDVDDMPVGALYTPPGHVSAEYGIEDLVRPESAVSSFGEAALPDIIESTVGLLSAADVSLDRPQIGDSSEDIADDVLIPNQASEEELLNFEKIGQPLEPPQQAAQELDESKEGIAPAVSEPEPCPAPEPGLTPMLDSGSAAEQLTLRPCSVSRFLVPKKMRKQGGRRGGLGRWDAKKVYTRRSSGDKDKQ